MNRRHNEKMEQNQALSTRNRLLNDQKGPTGEHFRLGLYRMRHNGCEVIAVHNARVLLWLDSTLAEVVEDFHKAGAVIGLGFFGSNPRKIGKVLEREGIKYTRISADEITPDGIYIVSYWNQPKPWRGLHTVAIGSGRVYNGSLTDPGKLGKRFICAYRLLETENG